MTDKKQKRSSRKGALSGQSKAQTQVLKGAEGRAAQELSNSMGNLNELFASQQNKTEVSATQSTASEVVTHDEVSTDVVQQTTEIPTADSGTGLKVEVEDPKPEPKPEPKTDPELEVVDTTTTEPAPEPAPAPETGTKLEVVDDQHVSVESPKVVEDSTSTALKMVSELPAAFDSRTGTLVATSLEEMHSILSASEGSMLLNVSVTDVVGSSENYRDFGIAFDRYLDVLPPLPSNWEELTGSEYVDQAWSNIIIEMSNNSELDDAMATVMRETLIDIFELGTSIQQQGAFHTPMGYLVYDQETRRPIRVELVSGEKRLRANYMFGLDKVVIKFTKDSTSVTPSVEEIFSRKELRLAENAKSRKPDDVQTLAGISDLHAAHIAMAGREVVEKYSTAELVRLYKNVLPCTEANRASLESGSKKVPRQLRRWVALGTHVHSAAFQRVCRASGASIKDLDKLRTERIDKSAAEMGCEVTAELIYAHAADADDIDFLVSSVPAVMQDRVFAALASISKAKTSAAPDLTDDSTAKLSSEAKAKMAKDSQRALGGYATTVMKGKNAAESRQFAFAQMLSMVIVVKGRVGSEDADMLHRLNSLRGEAISDDKLIEYRQKLISAYESIADTLGTMTNSSHETGLLIDRLASSADPLNVVQEFQKEHNTDGSAK